MGYIEPNSERWLSLEDLPSEEWKDIEGYEGLYQISNYGRVKSLGRINSNNRSVRERILRGAKDKDGYMKVILLKNNKRCNCRIHQYVGKYFVPNPDNKPIFNHIKPVTKQYCNNHYTNLVPMTISENNKYAFVIGNRKNPNPGVEIIQCDINNNIIKEWSSMADAAKELNLYVGNIWKCCIGKRKTTGGFKWRYKEEDDE